MTALKPHEFMNSFVKLSNIMLKGFYQLVVEWFPMFNSDLSRKYVRKMPDKLLNTSQKAPACTPEIVYKHFSQAIKVQSNYFAEETM